MRCTDAAFALFHFRLYLLIRLYCLDVIIIKIKSYSKNIFYVRNLHKLKFSVQSIYKIDYLIIKLWSL